MISLFLSKVMYPFLVCKQARSFDLIYDCATASGGGEWYFESSKPLLKDSGVNVTINGGLVSNVTVSAIPLAMYGALSHGESGDGDT